MTQFKLLDISDPNVPIEIKVRHDGKVIWVNVGHKCALRICGINEPVVIVDERKQRWLTPS